LEAIASGCRIIAHDNPFNRSVMWQDARYFRNSEEAITHFLGNSPFTEQQIANNHFKITSCYTAYGIAHTYQTLLEQWAQPSTRR